MNDKIPDRDLSPGEMRAILRHKWVLSERRGSDVGLEYAFVHWLTHPGDPEA